jgi:hypothetical protein
MSFTATNNGQGGGMPDIQVRMVPSENGLGNYESQGVDRAVTIGQDGRPIGNVQYVPPFDLLTEENRHIIEQRKRQKEAERNKRERKNQPPKQELSDDDRLNIANKELIGREFQYIVEGKFGQNVSVTSCQIKEGEIELIMSDDTTIMLNDLESQFIPISQRPIVEESHVETKEIDSTAQISQKNAKIQEAPKQLTPVVLENKLPDSPLRALLSSRKKNETPISVDLKIDLVKKDFFKIIDESYDDALDYVVEHVMSNVTLENVKEAIRYQLELYYKSEGRSLTNDEFEKNEIYKEPDTIILEKS